MRFFVYFVPMKRIIAFTFALLMACSMMGLDFELDCQFLPRPEGLKDRPDQRLALRVGVNAAQEHVHPEIGDQHAQYGPHAIDVEK